MKEKIIVAIILIILALPLLIYSFKAGALFPSHWSGLIIYKNGKVYGFRFAFEKNGRIADGYDTFFLVEEPGTITPDLSYAELSFNTELEFGLKAKTPILLKNTKKKGILKIVYGKKGEGIYGYVTVPEGVKLYAILYKPWGIGRDFEEYKGERRFFVSEDKKVILSFYNTRFKTIKKNKKETWIELKGRIPFFYFGFNENPKLIPELIKERLLKEKNKYIKNRLQFKGEYKGIVSSITQNLYWMKLLQPEYGRIYVPAGRRWIFPGIKGKTDWWTLFEWDSFFNALELSIEDKKTAIDEIYAVLDTQYPWGNIPNWRSKTAGSTDRAQPPVGSYIVLKLFHRTGDIEFLKNSYKKLVNFHRYWTHNYGLHLKRDGNNNLLFEWGSDTELVNEILPPWEIGADGRTRAAWESGQDDLPNYDNVKFNKETHTIELDCVDLTSLVALDAISLSKIAEILGHRSDSEYFKREYKKIKDAANRLLFDNKKNFYFDRYWDGKFSYRKAASNFYPLIAGFPKKEMARKIVSHLLNPDEFWGEYIVPTISRDDKAFKDQQYWRGTIWPPTNYLIYQGLKLYGFDEVASELAKKSARLFLKSWRNYRLCRENYNSITGKGGGQRYQSWGPLFSLILLEDFIDITPFEGLRVGNLSANSLNAIKNYNLRGNNYELIADKNSLKLFKNKKFILSFKGRAVLRKIKISKKSIEFLSSLYSDYIDFNFNRKLKEFIIDGEKFKKIRKVKKGIHKIKAIFGD